MNKNKFLTKLNIDIKDYNNELEKILENKLFSFDVKNLLLSMLYKIENAYKDYETVKVETLSKKEYMENLLRIIDEKVLKIFLVKPRTNEAKELEAKNITYKVDKNNGEIVCFQNEMAMLAALLELDESDTEFNIAYEYVKEPVNKMINQGKLDSELEVIRDFNGWSWNIETREIKDIEYNFLYQNLILSDGINFKDKDKQFFEVIMNNAIRKYISFESNKEYKEQLEKTRNIKQERLQLIEDKKEFLNTITEEKKNYTKQIERIDKIINDNELLKKEYYARNEKLPNKEKIFSVSYLVGILDKERVELLEKINEANKMILPKEFIEQKQKIKNETEFLNTILEKIKKEDIIEICEKFLAKAKLKIEKINEENKNELTKLIYKIRYYRYIPINGNECIKDIKELDEIFEKLIKQIIKKAQKIKLWDIFSEDFDLTYKILEEIFDIKIINLKTINLGFKYENKVLYIEYYDDTVIESTKKIDIDNVRIKKKVKLFI